MRVLLVQPPLDPTTSKLSALGIAEPLGLEYVAAGLSDHDVEILDLRLSGSLIQSLERFVPQVVGITAVTTSLPTALGLFSSVKAFEPGVKTVIGGAHATLCPEDCQVDQVDVIVRGDGEETMSAVVGAWERNEVLGNIPSITFREQSDWTHNPSGRLAPLDRYPMPARHLTDSSRSAYFRAGIGSIVSMISSRGCSRRCTFCSIWRFNQGKYRKRSVENLVAEMATRDEAVIDFVDDDSFADIEHMERLRQVVAAELTKKTYRFYVRADSVVKAPTLFERWAETGLGWALMGIEAFTDEELRQLNKSATASDNLRAIQILKAAGIRIIGYVMVKPDYQRDDFQRLSDTVERCGIESPVFCTLTPFPGTVLYEQVKDEIIAESWEDFDGFKSVVKTALPPEEFYHELANLFRRAYGGRAPTGAGAEPAWWQQLASAIEQMVKSET